MIPQSQTLNNSTITDQTIVALCTPTGSGAIALIRLSGDDAFIIVDAISKLANKQSISSQKTHTIVYGWVIDQDHKPIDQVLFLIMHAPKTFTGQNVVEITCHNNQFLIEAIIDRAISCGARRAHKGEFSQRAVLLGKIDLLQAEAIADLIHAQTSEALKMSMAQLEGSLSNWINTIEHDVLTIVAFCQASFEFLDEEIEFAPDIIKMLETVIKKIDAILMNYPKQKYIKDGIKVALIGSANAGKSSLFNALVGQNRAIVTPIAGTTRDTIETTICRNQEFLTFIDTAGIRKTDDQIEQYGIDRSFQQAAQADIILLTMDNSKALTSDEIEAYQVLIKNYSSKIIQVFNKIDLNHTIQEPTKLPFIKVSAHEQGLVEQLLKLVIEKSQKLKESNQVTYLLNQRQHDLLLSFSKQLNQVMPLLHKKHVSYELIVVQLQEALQLLSEMTGRAVNQAAFDKIFNTFCVGK